MTSEESIYKPLVGEYVQVDYDNGAIFGKLIKANTRFLELQPIFHVYYDVTKRVRENRGEKNSPDSRQNTLEQTISEERTLNLEEIKRKIQRNCRGIIDTSKVRAVQDITVIFRDEWKLI